MIVVDNTDALRDWLIEELEPICDADPGVLAKYILALIKRDKEEEALRTKCLTSLDVFLAKETTAFVDKLIHTLVTQSYAQEEYDPTDWTAPQSTKDTDTKIEQTGVENDDVENTSVKKDFDNGIVGGTEVTSPAIKEEEGDDAKEGEILKRERRSLSDVSSASENETKSRSKSLSKEKAEKASEAMRNAKKRRPARRQVVDDRPKRKRRKEDKERVLRKKRKEKTRKCPDYEEKGFCKKGDTCPFDHGSDPFKVDKLPSETSFMSPMFPTPFAPFPPPGMPFPFPPPGLMPVPPPGLELLAKIPPPPVPSSPVAHLNPDRAPKRQASENIISLTQPRQFNNVNHNNGKRPKFTPWVKGRGTPENTTIELRKIPLNLNSEEKLREHFEKFGSVEQITVGIADDQQAAVVKFATHASARSACQAPEPVFNNRFIAVFWHATSTGTGTNGVTPLNGQHSSNQTTNNGAESTSNSSDPLNSDNSIRKPAATRAQRAALARSQSAGNTAQVEAQEAMKQQKIESTKKMIQAQEEVRKKKEEERKSAIKLKTSLIEQKRELLSKYVEEQKRLLDKMTKDKSTMSANDKKVILATLKSLEESCAKLRSEIDQMLNAAKPKPVVPPKPPPAAKLLSSSPLMKHKRETQKELLDAELELLTDKNAEEKLQLQKRLIELKKEAVQLGVMGRIPRSSVPVAATPAAVGVTAPSPHFASPFLGTRPYMQPPQAPQSNTSPVQASSPTLDNRPKTIKVSGFELEEKDEVIQHFSKLGKVESKWEEGGVLFFEYRNRIDSQNAAQKGFKFKNKTLTVHWHRGPHRNSSTSLDDSGAASLSSSLNASSSVTGVNFDSSAGHSAVTNTHELARVRMESRDSSFSALLTEDDEEEAERLWRMTANVSY